MANPQAPAVEKVVFGHAVDAFLLRAMKGKLNDALVADIRAMGVDLSAPLQPAYPVDAWFRVLELIAKRVFGHLPLGDAYNQMGRALVKSYEETLVGKALFAALRVLSPRRAIARTARNFRTSNNYTAVEIVETSATSSEVLFNIVSPHAAMTQGILQTGLAAVGLKEVAVDILWTDEVAARYRISWKE